MCLITQGKTNWKFLMIVIILAAIVGGGIWWWQYWRVPKQEINSSTGKDLTIDQIKNAEVYSDVYPERVKLVNGRYDRGYSEGATALYVLIDDKTIAFGDLDNDGAKEAALIVYWSGGGSGRWRELTILKNINDQPVFITSEDLGDRTIINSIAINSGIITVDMIVHRLSDPMCCPTLEKIVKYKLSNNQLMEIAGDETADWKTYQNETYKYEIKYPPTLQIYQSGFPLEQAIAVIWLFPGGDLNGAVALQNQVSTYILDNGAKQPLDSLLVSFSHNESGCKMEADNNNFARYDCEGSYLSDTEKKIRLINSAFANPQNNTVMIVSLSLRGSDFSDEIKIYNQMLSTFKFLE